MRVQDIPIKDIMIKYGGRTESDFDMEGKNTVTLCTFHTDSTPSLKFYTKHNVNRFKCFACGKGGDGIDMAMHYLKVDKRDKAEQQLMADWNITLPDKVELEDFCARKGLDPVFCKELGWNNIEQGVMIPYYGVNKEPLFNKVRAKYIGSDRFFVIKWEGATNDMYPYGLWRLKDYSKDTIYIAEGETDAVTLMQAGLPCLGIPSANGWNNSYDQYIADFERIVVVTDNDEAGKALLAAVSHSFPSKTYAKATIKGRKDVNDIHMLTCGGDIEDFKACFASLHEYPASPESFIAAIKVSRDLLYDERAWVSVLPALKNPIKREDFINEIAKEAKLPKAAIQETMDRAASLSNDKLPEWYTIRKTGIELNPEVFAEHLADTLPIRRVKGLWHLYANGVYVVQLDDTFLHHIIRKELISECSKDKQNILDVMFYLNSCTQLDCEPEDFDSDGTIINVRNGLLDLSDIDNIVLQPHTSKYLSLVQLNVNYNPTATVPELFQYYLDTKLIDIETRTLVQDVMGYLISSYLDAEKWFLIWGGGRSGKGTLLHIITTLIGRKNISTVPLQKLGDKFSLSQLYGKRLNIEGDLAKGYLNDDTIKTLKSIVGRDDVNCEFKGETGFPFTSTAKMIYACNDLPQNAGDMKNSSFWNKLILIQMNNSDDDNVIPSLKRDIVKPDTLEYIFLWALEGLKRVIKSNFVFSMSEESVVLKEVHKRNSSSVLQFIEDKCEVGSVDKYYMSSDVFMEKYGKWCEMYKGRNVSKGMENIITDLKSMYPGIAFEKKRARREAGNIQYLFGVRLQYEYEQEVGAE